MYFLILIYPVTLLNKNFQFVYNLCPLCEASLDIFLLCFWTGYSHQRWWLRSVPNVLIEYWTVGPSFSQWILFSPHFLSLRKSLHLFVYVTMNFVICLSSVLFPIVDILWGGASSFWNCNHGCIYLVNLLTSCLANFFHVGFWYFGSYCHILRCHLFLSVSFLFDFHNFFLISFLSFMLFFFVTIHWFWEKNLSFVFSLFEEILLFYCFLSLSLSVSFTSSVEKLSLVVMCKDNVSFVLCGWFFHSIFSFCSRTIHLVCSLDCPHRYSSNSFFRSSVISGI